MRKQPIEEKVRRKIKLARTAPPKDKAIWAGYVLILVFTSMMYLKGAGLLP